MKGRDKANYFTRYLLKKQHLIKTSMMRQETKTQSSEQSKQQLKRKKTEDTSTTQASSHIKNKKPPTHKKGKSTQLELIIPIQSEQNIKQSFEVKEEVEMKQDQGPFILISKEKEEVMPKEMTEVQISFFKKKIDGLLNIIDEFERENNLNQEWSNSRLIYELEPHTERISNKNKMNDYSSPPNSTRINKTSRHMSVSSKDSAHYFTKKQNVLFLNANLKARIKPEGRMYSDSKPRHSASSSVTKPTQHSKPKNNKLTLIRPRTNSEVIKPKPQDVKPNGNKSKGGVVNKASKIRRNEKMLYAHKYIKENSNTPNDRNDNNTLMSDISFNIVLEENATNNDTLKKAKKLMGFPIKNFLKIKEPDIAKSKCQSERNKSSHKTPDL